MENVIVFVSKLTFKERNSSKSIQKWVSILQTKASMCSIENCTEHKMTRGPSSPNKLLPIKRREQQNHPKIDTKETKHSNTGAALLKLCREKKAQREKETLQIVWAHTQTAVRYKQLAETIDTVPLCSN